ncbi:hypothetical protein JKP88DRAFT_170825 [Tribonema minus]|uniref:non-specific serine/threonine protein kinase n=1 Tax=Tribonema minus TaxID=303371 RepID=A0A836C8C8_9STRA|nr:hypothetical protein JKP88DRAFT_170825 [Tribonema minus]
MLAPEPSAAVQQDKTAGSNGAASAAEERRIQQERQLLLIMLLAQVCSQYDATPSTFISQVLRLYELKVLDSISFLYEMGFVRRPPPLLAIESGSSGGSGGGGGGSSALPVADRAAETAAVRIHLGNQEPIPLAGGAAAAGGAGGGGIGAPSRYRQDFEEIGLLAAGAFGDVFRTRHRLDGAEYAIKKVAFRGERLDSPLARAVLREVNVLSQIEHPNCVRYHTAWLESSWVPKHGSGSSGGGGGMAMIEAAAAAAAPAEDAASEAQETHVSAMLSTTAAIGVTHGAEV